MKKTPSTKLNLTTQTLKDLRAKTGVQAGASSTSNHPSSILNACPGAPVHS